MKKDCLYVAAALIVRDQEILLARKAPHKSNGGLWEFPGGKMEAGESVFSCVEREIAEELGMAVTTLEIIGQSQVESYLHELILFGVVCSTQSEPTKLVDHDKWGWFPLKDIASLDLAPADVPLLDDLEMYLDKDV